MNTAEFVLIDRKLYEDLLGGIYSGLSSELKTYAASDVNLAADYIKDYINDLLEVAHEYLDEKAFLKLGNKATEIEEALDAVENYLDNKPDIDDTHDAESLAQRLEWANLEVVK